MKARESRDLNRLMNFKENLSDKRLVCIANTKTSEVLRVPYKKALEFMFKEENYVDKKGKEKTRTVPRNEGWEFTNKRVYKQYIDSQLGIIPPPTFTYFDRKTGEKFTKNTFRNHGNVILD